MRGRVISVCKDCHENGITPAYAGKRSITEGLTNVAMGSPPRMRGREVNFSRAWTGMRITPAYAGKRRHLPRKVFEGWDHPRVCGEEQGTWCCLPLEGGSPPRMRGRAVTVQGAFAGLGITPAYAGKSRATGQAPWPGWDHPRVCGEEIQSPRDQRQRYGSPPRMRGREHHRGLDKCGYGITPAYAGKSMQESAKELGVADHPRVCGEEPTNIILWHCCQGSPPRMRGRAAAVRTSRTMTGITPAYAGKRR